ncbi:SOS response-associated peptidase [Photobacterium sp. DNB23_23_1]
MCGRFGVGGIKFSQMVSNELCCDFSTNENMDLRPTQAVSVVVNTDGKLQQLDTKWGIQPDWAKKIIINAQSETAAEKKTFKQAMASRRCLVPCAGWYEWRDEGGSRKQKYYFCHQEGRPIYMGGIWFPSEVPQLVTITTQPYEVCEPYHHRMPYLVSHDDAMDWLTGERISEKQAPLRITPSM